MAVSLAQAPGGTLAQVFGAALAERETQLTLLKQGWVEKVVIHQIHQPDPCLPHMPEGPEPVARQIAHHHDKMGRHHQTLDVRIRRFSGINLHDLSLPRLQWAPQEMVDGRASALMEQNHTLTPLRRVDAGQWGKRHLAVD
jgi:hypothetical protein